MGKLIVTEFVTLDGVAQAPGGPDEDRDGGFAYGGWQAPLAGQESGGVIFMLTGGIVITTSPAGWTMWATSIHPGEADVNALHPPVSQP